jgi:DNA-binding transcriptional regulator YdaS (Cro superfamily)
VEVDLFVRSIDIASRLCGSQNELAKRIGAESSNLAQAKLGNRRLNREHIEALAAILETDASELCELQELANMPRRNPFRPTE